MPFRRKRNINPLILKAAELGFAAPQVVAHRVTRMAMSGFSPTARDRKELRRMGIEKMAAFTESWNAMAMETLRANQALTASFWRSIWLPRFGAELSTASHLHNAALGVLRKGIAPVHRRAIANARRLTRTRLF
jgi:hypothetical protein